jgi:hypothetical protein
MSPVLLYFFSFEFMFRIYVAVSKILFHPFYVVMRESRFF